MHGVAANSQLPRSYPPGTGAALELRPLSLGEVLDRIFTLYRSRFWLFAAISSIMATAQVITQAISLTAVHGMARQIAIHPTTRAPGLPTVHGMAAAQIWGIFGGLLVFLVASITQAATVLALSRIYLMQPAAAGESLRTVAGRWYRWMGIAIWQAFSFAWVPLAIMIPAGALVLYGTRAGGAAFAVFAGVFVFLAVLAGIPVGVILYLRNALAIPAAVSEGLKVRAAMRRSKVLSAGTKGRIFVVLLISGVLYMVVGVLQTPATFLIMLSPTKQHYLAQAFSLIVTFIGTAVVAPVALIGLTLVYFDQRVRMEAFDLQLMLEGSSLAPLGTAPGAPAGSAASGYVPGA